MSRRQFTSGVMACQKPLQLRSRIDPTLINWIVFRRTPAKITVQANNLHIHSSMYAERRQELPETKTATRQKQQECQDSCFGSLNPRPTSKMEGRGGACKHGTVTCRRKTLNLGNPVLQPAVSKPVLCPEGNRT